MRASRVAVAWSSLALAAVLSTAPSCTEESIILATVPASDAGSLLTPVRCSLTKDCPAGSFCAKAACSDTTGSCALFPPVCGDQPEAPVCGCDSITYDNDCLRQAAGITASTPKACEFDNTTFCTSDGTLACPDPTTQSCAFLIGSKGPCPEAFPGTCWVLPATCPTPPDGPDRWNACDQADQTDHCLDTCAAIRSGKSFRRASQCPGPPPG